MYKLLFKGINMNVFTRSSSLVLGGKPDYGYCRASLAKRYNDETKRIGKTITRRKVKEIPIHLGC